MQRFWVRAILFIYKKEITTTHFEEQAEIGNRFAENILCDNTYKILTQISNFI